MKLSTKKNRFPHTFSKARALESVYVTRPCPASSPSGDRIQGGRFDSTLADPDSGGHRVGRLSGRPDDTP